MFVIASCFSFGGPLLLGIVLDNFGPRVCSVVSSLAVGLGCAIFSISNKESFPMFIPAMSLIAIAGPGVQSAIIHLSNLFPTMKATATAIITGSFQLSFSIFFVFDQLFIFRGWSFKQLFSVYSFICLGHAVLSFLCWPDTPYHFVEELSETGEVS
jgi:predicted MFS family arabinose efflux permease